VKRYYVLDKKDITNIVDVGDKKTLMKKYNFEDEKKFIYVTTIGTEFNGYYFIPTDDDKIQRDEMFEDVLFHVNEKANIKYYVNCNGFFFSINQKGQKRMLNPWYDKSCDKLKLKIGKKGYYCATLIAKTFRKDEYNEKDIILYKDNNPKNLNYKNLVFVSKSFFVNNIAKRHPKARKLGVFDENNNLIKQYDSIRKASKDLYVDRNCIVAILKGKTKHKMFDIRYIE
jgi:hypothetical protein